MLTWKDCCFKSSLLHLMHNHVPVPSPGTALVPCFPVDRGFFTPRQEKSPAALIPTLN